jgi:DNA-binding LytR/AlgR family response regulator
MFTTLIIADNPRTRTTLWEGLEAQGISILGEGGTGARGLQLARERRPDLVLLDLDLTAPGLTGLQVGVALQRLDPSPLVVFISASSQHAVTAFEQGVLDYLIKPLTPDRLVKTLVRARCRLADRRARREAQRRALERALAPPGRRVPVWTPSAVRLIRVEEIDSVETREQLVYVRAGDTEYRASCSLGRLESLLPPQQFLRIHNSHLVRLERVEELLFLGNHRYGVRLSDDRVLPVGRSRYPALRQRLGLDRTIEFGSRLPDNEPEEALFPA